MSILSTSVQKTAGQLSMSDLAKAVKKPAVRHVHKPDIPPPTEPKATRPHKTPGHIIAAIRADRRTGMTYAAIAERHGVSQSVAQQACYDMAVGRSRSIFTDEFKRSVIADWKLGLTIVCEKYGLTEGQAKNIYARRMKK
ncbi:MAG: hypothetical protein PHN76_13490 [Advenella sp.]|uniref:hypothetical protein n=1 Tax=Advenella sp. TaxID=1872388 RepID=UPI00258FE7B3|nr:hypothetical protein [Advenella sp.]MDD3759154.1 hypothetical protein [Advenella sp.]